VARTCHEFLRPSRRPIDNKNRPTIRSESWGGRVNSSSPRVPLSHSVRLFRHEEKGGCF
jgi:hypothetical protein